MNHPTLNYVSCPAVAGRASPWSRTASPAAQENASHRMAYWEWNRTGDPNHPHVVVCVHGLSRQGRDFDVLAERLSERARVICPDVVGRGESDWLQDPAAYQVPLYAADMLALLAQVHAQAPVEQLDWVGTSMGGLIGMALAGQPGLPLPVPIRRLVLNDVGPVIEWSALERIGQYLGKGVHFENLEQAAHALLLISEGFGPHSEGQWLRLTQPMMRPAADGGLVLHYDPQIAVPLQQMTREMAQAGEALLWQLYDQIKARVLLVRGAQSDLLTAATAQAMAQRGPKAHCVEFEGVGHAPTFVAAGQVALLCRFLWGEERLPSTMNLAEQARGSDE
ncbi:alpha/beta hydrolase [Delftia acidovorans]|uniref:alpha/beta fold hydrolase n=1 Tax=Delftia acidovorans TaxID=80866 RepID=UPI0028E819C0|nr:alpha/beta hydrolase [Delftia acidovorans]